MTKRSQDVFDLVSDDEEPLQASTRRRVEVTVPLETPLFRLNRLYPSFPSDARANDGAVGLANIMCGQFEMALLSNFMVDLDWMTGVVPRLKNPAVPVMIAVQHLGADELQKGTSRDIPQWGIKMHCPPLEPWGTHHSKFCLLKYPTGLRFMITTANFVLHDWDSKTQGVFYQDFPERDRAAAAASASPAPPPAAASAAANCAVLDPGFHFYETLKNYLRRMGAGAWIELIDNYDFSGARAVLITAVPGRHVVNEYAKYRYGQLALSKALKRGPAPSVAASPGVSSRLLMQFSSLSGSNEKWLQDLVDSMTRPLPPPPGEAPAPLSEAAKAAGKGKGKGRAKQPTAFLKASAASATKPAQLELLFPTAENVRTSREGWSGGGSLPCYTKSVTGSDMVPGQPVVVKNYLREALCSWEGEGRWMRRNSVPHIKSYLAYRVRGVGASGAAAASGSGGAAEMEVVAVDWFCLTSANFSQAAWGNLQNKDRDNQDKPGQIYLKSFELGVLFLPELLALPPPQPFCCTPGFYIERLPLAYSFGEAAAATLRERGVPLTALPLPYPLPPPRYQPGDMPLITDQPHDLPDIL